MTDLLTEESPFEFKAWPKTPRLNRDIIITEKIDGSNAAVIVTPDGRVGAQSRKRLVTPGKQTDNYGFASWVESQAEILAEVLGHGHHYGEWWGSGIGRTYGLKGGEKYFSLFNAERYSKAPLDRLKGVGVVPTLYHGPFDGDAINVTVEELRANGSTLVPGGFPAEGVIVYHKAAGGTFKILLENDSLPKGVAEAHDNR